MTAPTQAPFLEFYSPLYREACVFLGKQPLPLDFGRRFHETDAAFDWVTSHESDEVNILHINWSTLTANAREINETVGQDGALWQFWKGPSATVAHESTQPFLEDLSNLREKTKDAAETMPGSAGRMRESRRHYREAVQNIDARARAAWPHTVDETEALLAVAQGKGAESDARALTPMMQVRLVPQGPESEFLTKLGLEEPKPAVPAGEAMAEARRHLENFVDVVSTHAMQFLAASDRCRDDCRAELRRLATVIQWAADAWQLGKR